MITEQEEQEVIPHPHLSKEKIESARNYWRSLGHCGQELGQLKQQYQQYKDHPEWYTGYNPFESDYYGYKSYYHLVAFFDLAEDKLSTNNAWTFQTTFASAKNKNPNDVKLKERIQNMPVEELIKLMEESAAKKQALLMGDYQESNYEFIPAMIAYGKYTPQNAAYLLYRWLEYVERKIETSMKNMSLLSSPKSN